MSQVPPMPPDWDALKPGAARQPGKGLPTAALVLGILAFVPLAGVPCALAALILGVISLAQDRPAGNRAIAGMVLAIIGSLVSGLFLVGSYWAVRASPATVAPSAYPASAVSTDALPATSPSAPAQPAEREIEQSSSD